VPNAPQTTKTAKVVKAPLSKPVPVATKAPRPEHIAAGYKLIDRYQLKTPYANDLAGVETWHAVDFALDRPVSVLFLSGSEAEAGAEAARRAALLSDPRITKIIDVGSVSVGGETRHYIVTEPVLGPTMADFVAEMPLDSATTRTIIGELGAALDEADQHGLHHVALRPAAVRIHNGRVMLTGLGVDAELGAAQPELGDSEHQDALGLAALAYYALSGYWPLPVVNDAAWRRPGQPPLVPAPIGENGLVKPLRELAPGADPVLLELTDRAFGNEATPIRNPYGVVRHLSPWEPLAMDSGIVPDHHHPATGGVGVVGAPITGQIKAVDAAAGQPHRRSVLHPSAPNSRPQTGRIPRASKTPESVLPDEEPLHIRPAAELDRAIEGPPQAVPFYRAPRPPRPKGIPATPIVLSLALLGLLGGGAWAAHNVISPFLNPEPEHHLIDPEPPAYTAAPEHNEDGSPVVVPAEPVQPVEVHPVVVSAVVIDPYGDGERGENAMSTIDNDPATYWYTYTYSNPQFGGLKPGVGLFLNLQETAPVNSITLHSNGEGGTVEVRKTTAEDPSGGQVIATGEFGAESYIDFGGDVEVDSLMLWITGLPQLADGRHRLELREVTVR